MIKRNQLSLAFIHAWDSSIRHHQPRASEPSSDIRSVEKIAIKHQNCSESLTALRLITTTHLISAQDSFFLNEITNMGGIKSKRHINIFSLLFTISRLSTTSTGSSVDGSELKQHWLFDYSFRPDLFHDGTWKQSPCHPREPLKILHSQPMNEIPNVLVDLDVSSCCLGDTGILQVVQSFLDEILPPLQPAALQSSTVRGITLHSNMNRLTPHGATKLIQLLIHQQQASYQRYCIQNLQNTTTIQTNQSSSFISLHNDTIPTTTTNWTFYIHELDLGFNDLGGYHHHHQSQQEEDTLDNKSWRSSSSSHTFLKSIRHLLEDEHGSGLCPTIVRLDTCGLGPQACRFIGKVSSIELQYMFVFHTLSLS